METITKSVTYYSYGVGKGKSKVGGAPQMNSVTTGMPGCRDYEETKRGEGNPKTSYCSILLKLLIKSTPYFYFERHSFFFFFFAKIGIELKNKSATELRSKM